MSSPIHPSKSYEIGSLLAGYLPQTGQATPQIVLGLLSDLVGDEQALLAPLRHLVGLPSFSPLLQKAGTGTGLHERDAVLQTIAQTYSSAVVIALGQFLDGLLALPVGSTPPSHPKPAANSKQQPPGPCASANPYTSRAPAPSISIQQGSQTSGSTIRLLILAFVTALVTATAAVALRNGALCSVGIACPPGSSLTVLQGLDAAAKAGQSMDTATSLAAYGHALKALEDQLSSLNALAPNGSGLTADQSQRLARLQSQASQGRSRLAAGHLDQVLAEPKLSPAAPLTVAEPSDSQLKALLEAWYNAKAAVLAGKTSTQPLDTLARPQLVANLQADRNADQSRGESQTITIKIKSFAVDERSPLRIAVMVKFDYKKIHLDRNGGPTEATSLQLLNRYVFSRDNGIWRLASFQRANNS